MSTNQSLHIGKKIREVLQSKERKPSWLADKICCCRTEIYYVLKKDSINTALLEKISTALEFDFFKWYSDERIRILSENSNKVYK